MGALLYDRGRRGRDGCGTESPNGRAEEGPKTEWLGDRLSALHHQRQESRIRRACSREGGTTRPVSLPECERDGEYPAHAAGPYVPGCRAGWKSCAASAGG